MLPAVPVLVLKMRPSFCQMQAMVPAAPVTQHRMLGHGLFVSAAPGELAAAGAGGGLSTASSPGPCRHGAGVGSGRRAEGALWAGAGGQTVNTAKQAGLSAALLAAGREKITPGKRRGCGAGGAGCHSGTQPACHPRVVFHSQPGAGAGPAMGAVGPAGRASAHLCHLFPPAGGGSSGVAQLRTGCCGWVFWASSLWREPSGCPQNEEHGDGSASPRALPPPLPKCLPARLKASPGTGTGYVQQPSELPALLRAGLASASGQWLCFPGQVPACAGPSIPLCFVPSL